jgi:hypothetical protein
LEKALFGAFSAFLRPNIKFSKAIRLRAALAKLEYQPLVMEKIKTTKKALKSLLNDSMSVAIGNLELPKPSKKVKRLLDRSSKKLASEFVRIMKKAETKSKKADNDLAYVDDVLAGKKSRKSRKLQPVEAL